MTEQRRKPAAGAPVAAVPVTRAEDGDEAERFLGRVVAVGLPVVCVVAAIAVGFAASVGSALLVLASGALLGTIALLWASVRTLSGDAPLPVDLEALAAQHRDVDALGEQKRRVLRALKDLEGERSLGKIDEADYEAIAMQYREEAKALMREMDRNAAPALAEAERIAREYLAAQGLGPRSASTSTNTSTSTRERLACPGCATSNEPDAAFCKKCGAAMKTATEETDATS
jgi:rRNA maturation endonuclease Nob1